MRVMREAGRQATKGQPFMVVSPQEKQNDWRAPVIEILSGEFAPDRLRKDRSFS